MENLLKTTNHGPLITSSDYFGSPAETAGKFMVSVNAGAVRVLWPRVRRREIDDMRAAKYVIITRGLWASSPHGPQDGMELLWEDDSPSPYCLHMTDSTLLDAWPAQPQEGEAWIVTVWMWRDTGPCKILERPAHWRAASIPCLKPL
ncbi:MAG: hypothetical protein V4726_01065 [Verrucomicrobiota bacterium]